MEFLIFLAGMVIGGFFGAKISTVFHVLAFRNILKELGISDSQLKKLAESNGLKIDSEPEQEPQEEICEVRIEQHSGILYAFRKEDDKFLGQGKDRDTLIERLKSEFAGNAKLVIREEDGADLIKNG
jgi:hypothetical protein